MAGLGRKEWSPGDVLTSSDVNGYLMDQSVMVFAGTAARASAIPTPSAGMVAYSTATGVQVYDGADWADVASASGLTLVTTEPIGAAVGSVTVTDAFSATYNAYKIIVDGGVGSATAVLGLKLGATATGYYEAAIRANYSTGSVDAGSGANQTSFSRVGNVNANYINLSCEVINPFAAKYTLVNGMWISLTQGGQFSGYLADTTSYTAFTLTPASGTLTGGNIKVYGYKA
jgi:hypothetical protein